MRKLLVMRSLALISTAVAGVLMLSGCSTSQYVRTYYQDCNGRYYRDCNCCKVYLYRACNIKTCHGPYCHKDCCGRWFAKDSYGNAFYRPY